LKGIYNIWMIIALVTSGCYHSKMPQRDDGGAVGSDTDTDSDTDSDSDSDTDTDSDTDNDTDTGTDAQTPRFTRDTFGSETT
jgi:hypothetical protein